MEGEQCPGSSTDSHLSEGVEVAEVGPLQAVKVRVAPALLHGIAGDVSHSCHS